MLATSVAVKLDNNKIVNRGYIINPDGEIVSEYDKIHMFDISINGEEHYESSTIESGNKSIEQDDTINSILYVSGL